MWSPMEFGIPRLADAFRIDGCADRFTPKHEAPIPSRIFTFGFNSDNMQVPPVCEAQ